MLEEAKHFKEEAIPLIIYNPRSKAFEVTEQAQHFLRSVKGPIGVLGVAGMYRTGKSYLLNRMLLGRSNGFDVGPTTNACTKGLWVWSKPIQGYTPEGEPLNVLIIDSEGIGSLDEDNNHDVRIFSLVLLISSFFLYNSLGSIDQSALQSLSLVVNLTKHIQIKSNQAKGLEDLDAEEYAPYLPGFLWVVRDFALQLLDQDGDPITAKDYLEKALKEQKGFSDAVEQKNRIRRLLRTFFKDRDCFTMVRPTTKEEDLQNLELVDLTKLRSEFVDQVTQLRRKVINKMKPKILNGKKLSGEMLFGIAESYVNAINKGAVPNIESAWSYICKNECLKALGEAQEIFDRIMQEQVVNKLPMDEPVLKEFYTEAKSEALRHFLKKGVGSIAEDYVKDLKLKLKSKFNAIKTDNEKEARKSANNFLQQSFQSTERKLKENQFKSFQEFENELKVFQEYFLMNGPQGPNRRILVLDFIQKALADGADYFVRVTNDEFQMEKMLNSDKQKQLENELSEIKTTSVKEKETLKAKHRQAEMERAELEAREEGLRESHNHLLKEKEQLESQLNEKTEQQRREQIRQAEEHRQRIQQSEDNIKEVQRQLMQAMSEHKKEQELLEQKNTFIERQMEEQTKREKDLSKELSKEKKDHQQLLKNLTTKHDTQVKELKKKLEDAVEKIHELETTIQKGESKYEHEKQSYSDVEASLKSKVAKALSDLEDWKAKYSKLDQSWKQKVEILQQNAEQEQQQLQSQIDDLRTTFRNAQEEIKTMKTKADKDAAVSKQKLEFLELERNEAKKQLQESQRQHERLMKTIEQGNLEGVVGKEQAEKLIAQKQEEHAKEMQEMQKEYDARNKELIQQVEELTKKSNDLDLQLKMINSDYSKEVEELQEKVKELGTIKAMLELKSKSSDQSKLKMIEETENRFKAQILQLESEIEELNDKNAEESRSLQAKSEESLAQLKNFYEIEKERLENRLREDKERADRRYNSMVEEWEGRLNEEQSRHEDEMEMLQDEFRDEQMHHQVLVTQLEHDLSLANQKIEQLEGYIKELKENIQSMQATNSSAMETQNAAFAKERQEMMQRIENMTKDLTRKDRDIVTFETKIQSFGEQLKKKEKANEDKVKEQQEEKNDFNNKLEELRLKNQQLNDELMQRKLDYGRESALMKQQIEFQNKKIDELKEQAEEQIRRHDEKEKQQREDAQKDLQIAIQKLQEEKEATEQKYDAKRKLLKEMEANLHRRTGEMEREKSILEEKYNNLVFKNEDLQRQHENEMNELRKELGQLGSGKGASQEEMRATIDNLRQQLGETDKALSENKSAYERDQLLWKHKFEFLEQAKNQAKQDMEKMQEDFHKTVDRFKTQNNSDKKDWETAQQRLIVAQENKYKNHIKDLTETHQKHYKDLLSKNEQLERDLRDLNDQLALEQRGKYSEHGSMEKKLEELKQSQAHLQAELDEAKAERDQKIVEYQKMVDKERENAKTKRVDLERRCKDAEQRRDALVFEYEKERAKWGLEKDHLINQKSQAQEYAERLEKKKDSLIREVEQQKSTISRLKNQHAQRTMTGLTMINQSARFTERPSTNPMFSSAAGLRSGREIKTFIGDGGENRPPYLGGTDRKSFMHAEENSTPSTGTLENKSAKSGMSEEGSPRKELSSPYEKQQY